MRQPSFRFHDFPVRGYSRPIMAHMIIAIDGPSASGKGTLARRLAARLGYAYLDTGALYRCVGRAVLDAGGDLSDAQAALAAARGLSGKLKPEDLQNPALRTDESGQAASKVAVMPDVRAALFDFQRDFARTPIDGFGGVILDGRDIGTIVCPDADVKFFVTANTEERARRRFAELQTRGQDTTLDAVLKDMQERDARDAGRNIAPLKPAEDAHIIDTSAMGEAEVMELTLGIIRGHLVETAAKS